MALFITGDTHGAESCGYDSRDGYVSRLNMRNFPQQKYLTKDDYVVICGDFGGVFDTDRRYFRESESEKHHLDWLDSRNFTTLFVPGNHENYDRLRGNTNEFGLHGWLFEKMDEENREAFRNGYPQKTWHGGIVRVIRPSVLMLESGVFDLSGFRCFVYGGAASHDISGGILDPGDYQTEKQYRQAYQRMAEKGEPFRVRGLTFWDQEIPGNKEEHFARTALDAVHWKVDLVFTHQCPSSLLKEIDESPEPDRVSQYLELLKGNLTFSQWYFGHHHENMDFSDPRMHMLYDRIICLD